MQPAKLRLLRPRVLLKLVRRIVDKGANSANLLPHAGVASAQLREAGAQRGDERGRPGDWRATRWRSSPRRSGRVSGLGPMADWDASRGSDLGQARGSAGAGCWGLAQTREHGQALAGREVDAGLVRSG